MVITIANEVLCEFLVRLNDSGCSTVISKNPKEVKCARRVIFEKRSYRTAFLDFRGALLGI